MSGDSPMGLLLRSFPMLVGIVQEDCDMQMFPMSVGIVQEDCDMEMFPMSVGVWHSDAAHVRRDWAIMHRASVRQRTTEEWEN